MTTTPQISPATRPVRRPRRLLLIALLLGVGLLIGGELTARFALGLGDPPLYKLDPDLEYVLVPSRQYHRFGHDYSVNSHSMRSPEFPDHKSSPDELRVMVIGDSIVNGGARIDQSELATTLLAQGLRDRLKRPVTVGNISAGSWGPPNQLAYAKKLGLFDADIVILVLNSEDVADVPGLEYIGQAWPRERPWSALGELLGVYVPRYMEKLTGRPHEPPPPPHTTTRDQDIQTCRASLLDLIALARSKGAAVGVVLYLTRPELTGQALAGHATLRDTATSAGAPVLDTRSAFAPALASGRQVFLKGDDVHAGPDGQRLLASIIEDLAISLTASRTAPPSAP